MKFFDNYYLPTTVAEALELLVSFEGRARVVAGGTDLLVDTQGNFYEGQRPHFDALVDVTRIEGANEIHVEGEWIVVGCGVTHTQIVESALIQKQAIALAEACSVVGGPQVRNVATLVGNVVHALPAADGTVALTVLEAEALVAAKPPSPDAWRPLGSLFNGPGESAIDATREMIVALRFHPTGENEASAFSRIMRPQGVALPILGMAIKVKSKKLKEESVLENVVISAGPVAPIPFRARQTEEFLRGKIYSDDLIREAAKVLVSEARPRTSAHRATKDYRVELLPVLLKQTMRVAIERA